MEVHQNGDPSEKREQAHVDEEDIDDPECKTEFAGKAVLFFIKIFFPQMISCDIQRFPHY